MQLRSAKNLLLVKHRAMGDSIMGLSSAQYIKEYAPQLQITYAIAKWITPLYKNLDSAVDEILPLELEKLSDFAKLFLTLRKKKIDLIYECHQAGRTAKFFTLYSRITRTPYFFHNHHLQQHQSLVYDQGVIKPLIQRDLDGIWSQLNKSHPVPNYLDYQPYLKLKNNEGLQSSPYPLLFIFGIIATRETKLWPLSFYVELALLILQDHPQARIAIPVSPSNMDQSLKEQFLNLWKGPLDKLFFIETSLELLPSQLSGATCYIGNDTGLKHLCAAMEIPTLTLFGPEPPLEWHPYNTDKHPYLYRDGLECRTMTAHYCPLNQCSSMICLNQITPSQVYKTLSLKVLKTLLNHY